MKYFTVTYISQKTLHPEGYKTFTEFVAAETKHAAKLKALEVLSEKDPDCCMMYKVPRLDEISEEVYLSKTEQQLDIVDDMAVRQYCALLALFGEQESYDEDEVRDADDLLACPDDEPEIYARYSALLQKVSEYRAIMPKDAHLDDIRQMALRAYQDGDIQGEDVHKSDRITMIANNNNELPPEAVENSVEREGESAETVEVTESETSVTDSPDVDVRSSESNETRERDWADLELDIACALLPGDVDCHAIPCDWLEIAKHRVKRRDGEIVRWYQALRRFPDILATSRPSLFALICAAGRQKHTMTAEEIDAYLVESLGVDDEKDVAWLPDSADDVAAAPMMPGDVTEDFPDAEPETTEAGESENEPAIVAESGAEAEIPEFLRDLPLVNGSVEDGRPFASEDALNARLADIPVGGSLVLWGLDNGIYHAADGYSSTQIRIALRRGKPAATYWYKDAPRKQEESRALFIGSAVHAALLEPERFETEYACAPSVNLRTSEGKETLAAFEENCAARDATPIKREDFDTVCMMRDSVLAFPVVRLLLSSGVGELSVFWRMENGLLLKIRPDWLGVYQDAPFMLDVKTLEDVNDFGRQAHEHGYHIQAAYYGFVLERVFGLVINGLFCAIGKRTECGRYPVELGTMDNGDSEEGLLQVHDALAILNGPDDDISSCFTVFSRPAWARQADRKRLEAQEVMA